MLLQSDLQVPGWWGSIFICLLIYIFTQTIFLLYLAAAVLVSIWIMLPVDLAMFMSGQKIQTRFFYMNMPVATLRISGITYGGDNHLHLSTNKDCVCTG